MFHIPTGLGNSGLPLYPAQAELEEQLFIQVPKAGWGQEAVYDSCWMLVDLECVQAGLAARGPQRELFDCKFSQGWGRALSQWMLPGGSKALCLTQLTVCVVEDTYSSEETVDHQPVHLRVMDTADLDTPRNCERYLNWAHAFLVVYSVDSRQSFEGSSSYLELLALHAKETQRSFPALLLGNKLDMAQYRGTVVSACLDFEHVQHVFHEAVREARRELEKSPLTRPLFISEDRALPHQAPLTARHGLASCTFNTLSTVSLKEMPTVAQAKLVTVKSSRAQSKRKAPTLTLLKGFKIF
ncbi:Ras-like protein member 12 [Saguinus oedipus]|uniref:small monomeric GTPase n=1 Tax=Saguinus oedipus TaxID=9490 RepID=A0ABQ9V2E4_SAGOE|nr:Ras-like protein member 12 [Saguinus oedipus]